MLGYLTTKINHGRRIQTIFFVFLASFITLTFLYSLTLFYDPDFLTEEVQNNSNPYIVTFFLVSAILVFLEYNLVCVFGIIDLAKFA